MNALVRFHADRAKRYARRAMAKAITLRAMNERAKARLEAA